MPSHIFRMIKRLTTTIFLFFSFSALGFSQSFPVPYDFNFYNKIADTLYSTHQRIHSSLKSFSQQDSVAQNAFDSVEAKTYLPSHGSFITRKLFNEHLVQYYKQDYSFYFDFMPDFQVGKEIGHKSTALNTRGFQFGGRIGSQIYFHTSYFENQGTFPSYIRNSILITQVVPGQGYVRQFGNNGFDFSAADGYFSYVPSRYFAFELGHGKNFIGDGYRSILLSDNTFSYPYAKVTTTVGPFKYMNVWSQLQYTNGVPFTDSTAYPKKYAVFQYLDWNINKNFSFGVFENTMLRPRGFDLNFMNPIVFLRPVEYSIGNPDKSLLGFNGSYKFLNKYVVYGQLVISDFTMTKVFGDPGYFSNKQGFQLGMRAFNFMQVKKLNLLVELNTIRPFTYTAINPLLSYSHYGQALGDPLGASFREFIFIGNYSYRRFDLRAQFNYALEGIDDPLLPGQTTGGDIFKPYPSRTHDDGYFIGTGISTHLLFTDLRISYMLNYKNNLRLELGYTNRTLMSSIDTQRSNYFSFGIRASFRNFYYDF